MKANMLTKFEANLKAVIYCYEQEVEDYEQTIKDLRRYHSEFNDMIFTMYVYDLLTTEEWCYLNDRAYSIKDEYVDKLIALSVEREVKEPV